MRVMRFLFLLVVVITVCLPHQSLACTTFCFRYNGDWIYGRNFDWEIGCCLVIVNKRGVAKTAYAVNNPAQWVSKYGSVTFNQHGREFPLGGMNEAGLVVECMWLRYTKYPQPDHRRELTELQWIQYQLDNFSTVDQVIASDKTVRIDIRTQSTLHFLVCDRKGGTAVIEFLGGEMVVHTKKTLPVTALTNSTYEYSLGSLEIFSGDRQIEAFKLASNSLKRFVWAARGISQWNPETSGSPIDYAFKILDKVSVKRTMFGIVYDVKKGHIYFRTKANANIRFFNFNAFDFACAAPTKILDLSGDYKGDVTAFFSDYTFKANYDLIKKSFSGTSFLESTPENVLQEIAKYPETLHCKK